MSRVVRSALLAVALALVIAGSGCQRKVEVETGTRIVCSYGHTISEDVKTVRVPVKEAVDKYIKTQVSTCPKHAQAEKLYQEAQQAIADGDLKTARDKLQKVLALDKSFGSAASQLADIDGSKNPSADTGESDGGGGQSGDDPAASPTGKLSVWTPALLNGYTGGKLAIDVFTVTRDYRPTTQGAVAIMVIVAEQQRTAIGAKALMTKMVKRPCPYDAQTLTVKGRTAYFGTDNRQIATLAFIEGPVMVAVQVSASKGTDPKTLKSDLLAIADQLP